MAKDEARLREIAATHLGRAVERIEPMAAGLGLRRFHRLHFRDGAPATLVARIEDDGAVPSPATDWPAAPPWREEPPLEPIRSFLADAGLPVPDSALHLPAEGVDLLEDVGSLRLLDVSAEERAEHTREACALLPRLQSLEGDPDRIPAFGRSYDATLVATKAWKWLHWTIPMLLDRAPSAEEIADTTALFDAIAARAAAAPRRLAHRDFKAENLHLAPTPDGGVRLVMIDVQGAFLAPPEYDLACLLHDLQVEHAEAFVDELLERVRPTLPDAPAPETFRERFDALALARLCKDVSHVVHAGVARGDRRRWHEISRGLQLIERIAGRQAHTFPGLRSLTSVTSALTGAVESADSGGLEEPGPRRGARADRPGRS
ncbi:MAG: phosphotransferase [Myxococcales bacterium]|nr:phosphotransferase [Myxococcales bacterium]